MLMNGSSYRLQGSRPDNGIFRSQTVKALIEESGKDG